MRYTGKENRPVPDLADKAAIRAIIADTEWEFTRAELQEIIHREFFEDKNPLDAGIVDAAVARLLLLDGVELNANTLQRSCSDDPPHTCHESFLKDFEFQSRSFDCLLCFSNLDHFDHFIKASANRRISGATRSLSFFSVRI